MPKTDSISRNVNLSRDAVNGTYAWLKRQGLPEMYLHKIRVIANESVKLGMLINMTEMEKFQNGLEQELFDE